jgi:PAS domain S-box-containing protein
MREYVRHALAPPIFEGDEGRTRIAEAFNLLLDGSLLTLIAAGCVAVLAFRAAAPAIVAVVMLLFVVVVGVRASLRAGHFLLASLAWLVTLWSGTIFLALGLGGLTYASVVLYLPFVIHAGLLLRRSGALIAAGISLLSTAVLMTLGQIGSPAAVDIAGSPAIAMGLLGFMLCWTVVPMAVMLRSLSRALAEARRIVAERTPAEDLLWERESRFRSTFEQAAVGIAHVHPDGRFLRINQKFCDIVRYSPYELVACTFQDITYPDDLDADRDLLRQVLNGERANYSREKRYVRKDGSLVWVNVTVSLGRSSSAPRRRSA